MRLSNREVQLVADKTTFVPGLNFIFIEPDGEGFYAYTYLYGEEGNPVTTEKLAVANGKSLPGIMGEIEEFQMNYGMAKGVLVQNERGTFEYVKKASTKMSRVAKEKTDNVGTNQVEVEPENDDVDKAVQKIKEKEPEIIMPLSKIETDLDKDMFGEFTSDNLHTVSLNTPKIENKVEEVLKNATDEEIQKELIDQIALVISHESGHQEAYTDDGDTSEAPANKKEEEFREKITANINYRKRIMLRAEYNRNVVFSAILLTKPSKQALLEAFPPQHQIKQDGHVTLAFRPGKLPENLGEIVNLTVYGYANDNKADAVSVKLYDIESTNEIPHITLSVSEGTRPVYSNELLARGYEAVEPLELNGVVAAFMGPDGYITSTPELPEPVLEAPVTPEPTPTPPPTEIENTNPGENNV